MRRGRDRLFAGLGPIFHNEAVRQRGRTMIIVSHWLFGLVRNINHFSLSHRLIVYICRRRRTVWISLSKTSFASFAHPSRPLR
jgi:hypothetical protein